MRVYYVKLEPHFRRHVLVSLSPKSYQRLDLFVFIRATGIGASFNSRWLGFTYISPVLGMSGIVRSRPWLFVQPYSLPTLSMVIILGSRALFRPSEKPRMGITRTV
ncbi:hypothetical protein GGR50DRAFT_3155 [Xylaria sp. CBS 124048]|nr:hypothetical protein GGR50DRAFT_3155 [Xylaria sp. CBS 124048]